MHLSASLSPFLSANGGSLKKFSDYICDLVPTMVRPLAGAQHHSNRRLHSGPTYTSQKRRFCARDFFHEDIHFFLALSVFPHIVPLLLRPSLSPSPRVLPQEPNPWFVLSKNFSLRRLKSTVTIRIYSLGWDQFRVLKLIFKPVPNYP